MAKALLCAILSFFILPSFAWATPEETNQETVPWGLWVTNVVSRAVYFILICLITLCIAISTFKSKFGNMGRTSSAVDLIEGNEGGWLDSLYKAATGTGNNPLLMSSATPGEVAFRKLFCNKGDLEDSEPSPYKEELENSEHTITILKEELAMCNRERLDLEETLDAMDKDKAAMETLLECQKYQGTIEMEKLKKESNITRRQLKQALVERDHLEKEVEALQREARIVTAALRDNQVMDVRLEEAKKEITDLKRQMEVMKSEKDIAVSVVEQIMNSKGFPISDDIQTSVAKSLAEDQGRSIVAEDKEMAARLLAEVARTKLSLAESLTDVNSECMEHTELGDIFNFSKSDSQKDEEVEKLSSFGDAPMQDETDDNVSLSDEGFIVIESSPNLSGSYEELEDESGGAGLVTGSEAFRKFLQNNPILTGND